MKFSYDVRGHARRTQRLSSLLCLVSLLIAPSVAQAEFGPFPEHSRSKWEGPYTLPIVPAAAANMPDGRVVTWSAQRKNHFSGSKGATAISIFDPDTNESTDSSVADTDHDMFCPGTAQLADGTFLITGGNNAGTSTIFDPASNRWFGGRPMNISRGYHSMTTLHDGSVITVGGSWSGGRGGKIAEIWDPLGGWRLLPGIDDAPLRTADPEGVYRSDNHMWLFEAPNDLVFHAGPAEEMFWLDTKGEGRVFSAGDRGDDADAMNGTALMYAAGKVLTVGGAKDYAKNGNASNRAYSIDINNGTRVSVRRSGDMEFARTFVSAVVLPSGEVVVAGGATKAKIFDDSTAVYEAEIWNPDTLEFKTLGKMERARTYHSFALLLRDGRVLVGGGGLCGSCSVNHPNVEILTPPYLLNSNGSAAARPSFRSSAPSQADPGDTLSLKMSTSNALSFALVRMGAVTHSTNNDQRRISLTVQKQSGSTFDVRIPSNPAVAAPGRYWLFALNEDGVPSVGEVVHIGEGAASIGGIAPDAIGETAFRSYHGKYLRAEGNIGSIDARGGSVRPNTNILSAIHVGTNKIALRTFAGLFVSALPDGAVVANRTAIKAWEVFEVVPSPYGGGIALKTAHGAFLSARNTGNLETRAKLLQWESFTMITIGQNAKVSLESDHGTFLTSTGKSVSAGDFSSDSVFTLEDVRKGKIALRTPSGNFVSARSDYSVDASVKALKAWEKFDIRRNLDGTVSLKSAHGFFVSILPNGKVVADRTQLRAWEKFRLRVVQ